MYDKGVKLITRSLVDIALHSHDVTTFDSLLRNSSKYGHIARMVPNAISTKLCVITPKYNTFVDLRISRRFAKSQIS